MELPKPQKIVLVIVALVMVICWALVIWVAIEVTRTQLQTLSYIVDLAQMP